MADEQFPAAATALEEYQSIEEQMASPEVVSNPDKLRKLGRRHAELGAIVGAYKTWLQVKDDLAAAQEMAGEDADFAEEAKRLEDELPGVEEKLRTALIPRDPLRMYTRYAEKRGWSVNVQSENTTELGGVKDVQIAIRAKGTPAPEDGVWASMKYEGGVHRVQRIPVTESQGRIQTSAAGVIVFPEADEDDDEIEIDPKDLKIDIFMSSGPGGQSVNTTYSAVRMTHLPTGITVNMQDEKSQIQNRAAALRVLKSRLLAMKHEQEAAEAADMRHSQVRSLDRSERIRTYNFPENRIVDHRTNYKAYNLDAVLDGDLQAVIDSDIQADEADRLANQQ